MLLLPGIKTKSSIVLTAEECRVFRSFIMKRVQIFLKGVLKVTRRSGPVALWPGVIERGIALLDVSEEESILMAISLCLAYCWM